jgi:phosphohistidine phosphatase SixA
MITILLVRHADIDLPPVSADPPLNGAGHRRAEALAQLAGSAGVTTVFHSSFRRTRETVEPLKLPGREMPAPQVVAREASAGEYGPVVLIAGHSNTVPQVIAALGAPPPVIPETEFDDLFIVSVAEHGGGTGLLTLKYASPSGDVSVSA